jgi:TatD DNase family protein
VLTDTHCHLYLEVFEQDLGSVMDRAQEKGIQKILVPGIDLETSRQAVALTEKYPEMKAAVGVHPNDAASWNDTSLKELRELVQHPNVVAVGEIGLDFYWDSTPHDLQVSVFRQQLELAADVDLPVVIHNRLAQADLWPIVSAWQEDLEAASSGIALRPGVLHSFDGTMDWAREAVDRHFYFGIGGPVTFKNAPDRRQLVTQLPIDTILLETDAPYLTPHPFRGRRNEPAHIVWIAEKIAELHDQPLSLIAEQTSRNAERLFLWEP